MKPVAGTFTIIFIVHTLLLCQVSDHQVFDRDSGLILEPMGEAITDPLLIWAIPDTDDDTSSISYLVKAQDTLYFCDEEFKPIKSRAIAPGSKTEIITSRNRKFLLLVELITTIPEEKGGFGTNRLTLIDCLGNEYSVWQEKISFERYDKRRVVSGHNGYVYQLDNFNPILHIMNRDGVVINRIKIPEDLGTLAGDLDITLGGQKIYVLGEREPGFGGGKPHLFIFNKDGTIRLSKELPHEGARDLFIDETGSIIMCHVTDVSDGGRHIDKTEVYSEDITLLYSLPIWPYFRAFLGDYLALGYFKSDNNTHLALYDKWEGYQIWDTEIGVSSRAERPRRVTGFTYLDKSAGTWAAIVQKHMGYDRTKYWLYLIDSTGHILKQLDLGVLRRNAVFLDKTKDFFQMYFIKEGKINRLRVSST